MTTKIRMQKNSAKIAVAPAEAPAWEKAGFVVLPSPPAPEADLPAPAPAPEADLPAPAPAPEPEA